MITIKVDMGDVNKMYKFPSQINEAINITGERFVKEVGYRTQQAMKFFAPSSGISTLGTLKQSIKFIVKSRYKGLITTEGLYRPYDVYQNMEGGYTPHFAPIYGDEKIHEYAMRTRMLGGGVAKGMGRPKGKIFVQKYTPFVDKTMERVPEYIDRTINAVLDTELRKAMR